MDDTDRRIAELLREDGRASHRAIADALGLSPRAVGARIDAMLERREVRVAAVADVFEAGNDLVLAGWHLLRFSWGMSDRYLATTVAQALSIDLAATALPPAS